MPAAAQNAMQSRVRYAFVAFSPAVVYQSNTQNAGFVCVLCCMWRAQACQASKMPTAATTARAGSTLGYACPASANPSTLNHKP